MNFFKCLKAVDFYYGPLAPDTISNFNLYSLDNDGYRITDYTRDQCTHYTFRDYYISPAYPEIHLCLSKQNDKMWRFESGRVGLPEDGWYIRDHQELAAYVLQSLGVLHDIVNIQYDVSITDTCCKGLLIRNFSKGLGVSISFKD
jgi:hypothetical protein